MPISHPSTHDCLAALSLIQLREYRAGLGAEEDKVTLWRGITHARIGGAENSLSFEDLARTLGDTGTGQARRALTRIIATHPLPELPELSEMWTSRVDPQDPQQVLDVRARMQSAERKLNGYGCALLERIDAATRELMQRYREDPATPRHDVPAEAGD
jgi:hypothetical protein